MGLPPCHLHKCGRVGRGGADFSYPAPGLRSSISPPPSWRERAGKRSGTPKSLQTPRRLFSPRADDGFSAGLLKRFHKSSALRTIRKTDSFSKTALLFGRIFKMAVVNPAGCGSGRHQFGGLGGLDGSERGRFAHPGGLPGGFAVGDGETAVNSQVWAFPSVRFSISLVEALTLECSPGNAGHAHL